MLTLTLLLQSQHFGQLGIYRAEGLEMPTNGSTCKPLQSSHQISSFLLIASNQKIVDEPVVVNKQKLYRSLN